MKDFTKLITLLLTMFMSVSFAACSSDDDLNEEPESPEDNLPQEARAFVGYWWNKMDGDNFLFFGDGTCWLIPKEYRRNDQFNAGVCHTSEGYWTYDVSTKILATNIENYQWQVTLSNSEVWTGTSLYDGKIYNFEIEDDFEYMKIILASSSWEETADSVLTIGNYVQFRSGQDKSGSTVRRYTEEFSGFRINTTISLGEAAYIELVEDNAVEDYSFKYNLREFRFLTSGGSSFTYYWDRYSTDIIGTGTVTLKNPTSSTNCSLVFTGDIDKTLKRKATD